MWFKLHRNVSNSQVYSNDEFDLWPVYSGERFRAFRPSCLLGLPIQIHVLWIILVGWLFLGLSAFWDSISVYIGPSPREGERKEMIDERKNVPPPKVRGNILVSVWIPGVGVGMTSLYPLYFFISGWNFTRLAWIHHWDKPKSWLSFGDSGPTFKVTGGLRLLNFLRRHRRDSFLYPRYLLNQ